jgi:hypothetical protein
MGVSGVSPAAPKLAGDRRFEVYAAAVLSSSTSFESTAFASP